MIDVRVQAADFDAGRQIARLRALGKAAILCAIGVAEAGDDVAAVRIEHHAAMAKAELARIAAEACARWPLDGLILLHRHGRLAPGDAILFVAVASASATAAAEALAFLELAIARRAPFWRCDTLADGRHRWAAGRG